MSSGSLAAAAEARRGRTDRTEPARIDLERAIVQTVAYADVFDYPLTSDEVHRYLIGVPAGRSPLRPALSSGRLAAEMLSRNGRYFTLAGRESVIETRRGRAQPAVAFWRRALHYGHNIGPLPLGRV